MSIPSTNVNIHFPLYILPSFSLLLPQFQKVQKMYTIHFGGPQCSCYDRVENELLFSQDKEAYTLKIFQVCKSKGCPLHLVCVYYFLQYYMSSILLPDRILEKIISLEFLILNMLESSNFQNISYLKHSILYHSGNFVVYCSI